MIVAKPFHIPKKMVWEAYLRVKANDGGPGADGQSVEDFEVNRVRLFLDDENYNDYARFRA